MSDEPTTAARPTRARRRKRKAATHGPRTRFVPTPEQHEAVWAAIAMGTIRREEIAAGVINPATKRPIGVKNLVKHFPDELATARAKFKIELSTTLVLAMRTNKTNPTAIFLGKTTLNLRESNEPTQMAEGAPKDEGLPSHDRDQALHLIDQVSSRIAGDIASGAAASDSRKLH